VPPLVAASAAARRRLPCRPDHRLPGALTYRAPGHSPASPITG